VLIRKIGILGRTYRHIQRYRQILTILFKYGFGDLVSSLKIEQYLDVGLQMISHKHREKIEVLSQAERARMALEELGPTFIKMGQILSSRPDLLPVNFIQELVKLQDDVPPFSFSDAKSMIESELQQPLEDLFSHFEESPLAAASIGQVHRARLMDGDEVVVKVQRPDIQKTITVDMEIIFHIAVLMEKYVEGMDIHRPTQIIKEFARVMEREIDYTIEASHMERFSWQFTDNMDIYVPRVYREASTSRILTMEYINGIKISDVDNLENESIDRKEIAKRGAVLIMEQVFIHGFFHADPHPGNIFILPNNIICYLDFGMMGRVNRQTKEKFIDLIMGIVQRDEAKTADTLLKLTYWEEEPDRNALEEEVAEFIDQHFFRSLKELELGKLLTQLLEITSRYRLRLKADLFLMLKALTTVHGLGRSLDPDFDLIEHAAPFVRRIKLNRLRPRRIAGDFMGTGTELVHLMQEIPRDIRELLTQFKQGKVKIEFEHRGLEPMFMTHDRISNRLAFAIVLASLVIGSSLIVLSGIPPKWNEIPFIGLIGFLVAGVMGFWLLVSILRGGKL